METVNLITLIIAIWGAITGTIALFLKIRIFFKERPKLKVLPQIEYSFSGVELPPSINFKIKVTNIGRRPVYIGKIFAIYKSDSWIKNIFRINENNRFYYLTSGGSKELTEGKAELFNSNIDNTSEKYHILNIYKVMVIDETGKKWYSSKCFDQEILKSYLNANLLKEDLKSKGDKKFEVKLWDIGTQKLILSKYTKSNSSKFRRKYSKDHKIGLREFEEIKNSGNDYVNGLLDYENI